MGCFRYLFICAIGVAIGGGIGIAVAQEIGAAIGGFLGFLICHGIQAASIKGPKYPGDTSHLEQKEK